MATTTNYGWDTPDDTDLVKDGASAIRTLGSSVDTTTKNLNPQTTTGALAYRSATANVNTALPIGSSGQVLTVAAGVPSWATPTTGDIEGVTAGTGISGGGTSGTVTITNSMATEITAKADLIVGTGNAAFDNLAVGANGTVLTADSTVSPTGLKWAAPAVSASGLTLITRQTVTNAADTGSSFASIFSSTYDTYLVIIESSASSANMLHMQLKNASGNVTSSNYYGNSAYALYSASSFSFNNTNAAGAYDLLGATSADTRATIWINGVGNASERATWSGNGFEGYNNRIHTFAGEIIISDTFTGLNFKMASGNITLTASIYGLAK
jgi:hypothetical protein